MSRSTADRHDAGGEIVLSCPGETLVDRRRHRLRLGLASELRTQDVDPETYYGVGRGLFEKAGKLFDAFNVNVGILGGTGAMANPGQHPTQLA